MLFFHYLPNYPLPDSGFHGSICPQPITSRTRKIGTFGSMKRVLITCLALAALAAARPTLQLDRERIEAGQAFGLQFIVPLQELPGNREVPQLETKNGFTFMGLDSTDQVIRPGFDDMFESFFGGGSRAYKAPPKGRDRLTWDRLSGQSTGNRRPSAGAFPSTCSVPTTTTPWP